MAEDFIHMLDKLEAAMEAAFGDSLKRRDSHWSLEDAQRWSAENNLNLLPEEARFWAWASQFHERPDPPIENQVFEYSILDFYLIDAEEALYFRKFMSIESGQDWPYLHTLGVSTAGDRICLSTKISDPRVYYLELGGEEEHIFDSIQNLVAFLLKAFEMNLASASFPFSRSDMIVFKPLMEFGRAQNPTASFWLSGNNPPLWDWNGPL